jgi:hypothetical protein
LFVNGTSGRVPIADVLQSGIGARDGRGEFRAMTSNRQPRYGGLRPDGQVEPPKFVRLTHKIRNVPLPMADGALSFNAIDQFSRSTRANGRAVRR